MWQTKIKLSGRGRQWRLTKKIDPSMSAPLKIVGNGEPRDKRNRSPRLLIRFQQRGLLPRNSPMHGSALSWGEGLETSSDSLVPLLNNGPRLSQSTRRTVETSPSYPARDVQGR